MPVSEAILPELLSLYQNYLTSFDVDNYLRKNKKTILYLVDSLWEQITFNYTGTHSRNHQDSRRLLNIFKNTNPPREDIELLDALLEILREYDTLTDKRYVDTAKVIRPIFLGQLKRLCHAIASHSKLAAISSAVELKNILKEF